MLNDNDDIPLILARAERVLAQLEAWLPPVPPATDFRKKICLLC